LRIATIFILGMQYSSGFVQKPTNLNYPLTIWCAHMPVQRGLRWFLYYCG